MASNHFRQSSFIAAPGVRAWLLALGWAGALYAWAREAIGLYSPVSDEFGLMAHSHPAFAQPLQWFTEGFAKYFVGEFPELTYPATNFIRPVFNGAYWVFGQFLEPLSSNYLFLNVLVIAACAGAAYWCIVQSQAASQSWLTPLFALLVPLMPSFQPGVGLLFPCIVFDPMAACWCLLACAAYERARYGWAAIWMLLAVLTKETALPVAAALAALHAFKFLQQRDRRLFLQVLLLGVPLLIWLGLRLMAFQSLTEGAYAVGEGRGLVRQVVGNVLRWPFWVLDLPFNAAMPTPQRVQAFALLICNLSLMAGCFWLMLRRLWIEKTLLAPELALAFSYLFMLLVGEQSRFGAVLDVFLLVCLARWWAQPSDRRFVRVLLVPFVVGFGICLVQALQVWPSVKLRSFEHYRVSASYIEALRGFKPDDRVIVLNDPVTTTTPLSSLSIVAGVSAQVYKLGDYLCPWSLGRVTDPCEVRLSAGAVPGEYVFAQSCGLALCATPDGSAGKVPVHVELGDVAGADFVPAANLTPEPAVPVGHWPLVRLKLHESNLHLLYYDPVAREFRQVHVP